MGEFTKVLYLARYSHK